MKKIFLVIFGITVILITLIGIAYFAMNNRQDISELPEYYRNLTKKCESKQNYNCCLSSVYNMANGNFQLASEASCPEGYKLNMLRCADSFKWCEPIQITEPTKPDSIMIDGKIIKVGEEFQIETESGIRKDTLRLLAIIDSETLVVEYPSDYLVGPSEPGGPCSQSDGGRYKTILNNGSSFMTRTCDAFSSISFHFTQEKNVIKINITKTSHIIGPPPPSFFQDKTKNNQ